MQRVVVTGLGIISSIGNTCAEVLDALRDGVSGVQSWPPLAEAGFQSHVYAPIKGWTADRVPKRARQTSSTGGHYALDAALAAVADARLGEADLKTDRTGVIIGAAFGGLDEAWRAEHILLTRKSPSRAGGTGVVKMLNSSASGNVATLLGAQGRVYSLSSSFATGTDCIGHAYDLVRLGLQDVVLCGAAEEASWEYAAAGFAAARMLPVRFNDQPQAACRPFDRDREGLVFSEGAGVLVLESLEHARRRGVQGYAEVVGYGSANDGSDMFRPSGEGLRLALRMALAAAAEQGVEQVDYVNPHATGSTTGDAVEAGVLRDVLGEGPWVSATKGQTGHGMGAAGAQEAIYTLLMLQHNLVAPTFNLEHVAPECSGIRHVQEARAERLTSAANVNVGLGGTNACVVFRKTEETMS